MPYIPAVAKRANTRSEDRSAWPHDAAAGAVASHLAALEGRPARSGRATLRKEQGSHYTPPALVGWILDRAMDGRDVPAAALDPACGAGNFLVAVAERMIARGVGAAEALRERIFGIDIDATAVELCRARLAALLPADTPQSERDAVVRALGANIVVGDALARSIEDLTGRAAFGLIVGNPPFLNQLEVATSASRERAARVRERSRGAVTGYADLSAAFLFEACGHLAPGGTVGFVMPQSFLAAADARSMRGWLAANTQVRDLWTADERLFEDAGVRVCAVVAEAGQRFTSELDGGRVERAFGAAFAPLAPVARACVSAEEPWAALFSDARGVPALSIPATATIGAIAAVTADFRDQFYGLRGAIVDARDADEARFPRLVSTRHVDLAHCAWGEVPARILFERHAAPRADRATLERDAAMAAWIRARLVPKVLVATQTRVMEAVVDEEGAWLPVVPLLTATLREGSAVDLWMLAAAIASPVVTAEASRVSYGAALSAGAIKLSATQLLAMPLPRDEGGWRESAHLFRAASQARDATARERLLRDFAEVSCRAHALGGAAEAEVLRFWSGRRGGGQAKGPRTPFGARGPGG